MATIFGTSGDDILDGTSGDDHFVLSEAGDETVTGRKGNDLFQFGGSFTASDRVDGGLGEDQLFLDGNYRARVTFAADTMQSVENISLGSLHSYNLVLDDANVAAGGRLEVRGSSISTTWLRFDGSAETDGTLILYGGDGADRLIGGAMDDVLQQGAGADTMRGGGGDDFMAMYDRPGGDDRIDGGSGFDTFVISAGFESPLHLTGRMLHDVEYLRIEAGAGVAWSLSVADAVTAHGATLLVSWGGTEAGAFAFDGSAETDGFFDLEGREAADTLVGGRQNDSLFGYGGDDVLTGGRGKDRFEGGEGADRFVFLSTDDSTRKQADVIFGFAADDILDLGAIDADEGTDGDQAFVLVSAFSHAAGEAVFAYDPDRFLTELMLDVDGDGRADSRVVILGDQSGHTGFVL